MRAETENDHAGDSRADATGEGDRRDGGTGKDRRPSTQVLSALADALRLGLGARAHLYRLTKAADPHYNCLGRSAPSRSVREPVRAILQRLEPTPAVLLNRLGDILAHTGGFEGLMRPTGLLDEERPNVRGTGVVSLGSLRVRYETLDLPAEDDQRLVVLLV